MLVTQRVAFNSPVWFNVGCDKLEPTPKARAGTGTRLGGGVKFEPNGLPESAMLGLLHQCGR